MKKIVGIILAICMLSTMAFAVSPITGTATPSMEDMTIVVTYDGIADKAQATLLAYKVADNATVAELPDYVDEDTTPIVGIDQEVEDGEFSISVDKAFRGKIAVKVGGSDIDEPAEWLVEFKDAGGEGGGEEGGEEGGDDEEGVEVTVKYGDVDGDGSVGATDASLILQKRVGKITQFERKDGVVIPETVGDVDGDGSVGATDASLVLQYRVGKITQFEKKDGTVLTEYTWVYYAPAE